nr:hypothetical protein BaRGS_027212 [Batillaria attramentaria]
MKTLEDRWQKLHSKINCPPAHGSGGRFNWVARRLLSQRLSRIAKTKGSNTSSYDNNNHINNNNNRCNSTAPNTTTYKQSLGSEEGERDLCYDVNDSCVFGDGDRPARPVTALNADVGVRTLNPLTGGHLVRTAKTGVSQISHITTKSCPAALNVQASASTSGKDQWGRSRPVGWGRTGGSRRQNGDRDGMRVFAHMSVEARHAITETLREMGVGNNDNDRNDDGGDEDSEEDNADESDVSLPSLPDQHRRDDCDYAIQPGQSIVSRGDATTINSNNNNRRGVRQGDATSSVNATVRGGRSPRRSKAKKFSSHHTNGRARPKSCKTIAAEQDEARTNAAVNGEDLDLLSMASLGSASSGPSSPTGIRRGVTSDHTRLPAITSRTEPHVLPLRADTLRHVNYRIQGVGSYRVAREATFEITAPDFDIRYRDVITCQKGDRDTPPPDIFDRHLWNISDTSLVYAFKSIAVKLPFDGWY